MPVLGPFELHEPIGSGGMGEVWRATHTATHVPVAIKVIKGQSTDAFREAFLHEVRLVAGLRHRNVILALDLGTVPASADPRLRPGAPFLAMELAGGGSLSRVPIPSWKVLKHVLLQLFEGLAHAHARGVVHRDIKPANLLVAAERSELASEPDDLLTARIVLTDFGIGSSADGRDPYAVDGSPIGTPAYMAPEQVEARWRDHGPWTDLYAVGVVAFQMASGQAPFRGHPSHVLLGHVRDPVPPLEPLFDVPVGFEAFVRQLLAKRPQDRFVFATDARKALLALGDPEPGARRGARARRRLAESDRPTEVNSISQAEIGFATGGSSRPGAKGAWSPRSWQDDATRDLRLEGAGLGLYGLRAIPLVDRVTERDLLWGSLLEVRTSGEARVVVLRGPSGTGKSRLVEWLAHTAHEVGAAVTLKAVHTATGAEGLGRLVQGYLRLEGLAREALLARLSAFSEDSADALARLVSPHLFDGTEPLTRKEAHAAMERFLRAVAGERSVVVWLEDAHLSLDALAFCKRMTNVQEPVPALILLTIQDEALAERPEAQELLREVLKSPAAREAAIGPLGAEDHQELVRALLGLEGSVAQRVEEKTQGNPLFAIQLVGDWVARGLLVPSERGFRLRKDALAAELPADMLAVWEERVARLLEARGEHDAEALELLATWGLEQDPQGARELCARAGLSPAGDLVGELMRRRLAQPIGERGRWVFVHGMLREVLQRRARAGGRATGHHRVCAAHLRAQPSPDPERLARHLLDAGEPEEALGPLAAAIGDRLARGDFRSSALLLQQEEALRTLGVAEDDVRWAEVWLSWAWLFRVRGELAEAERWCVRAERAARRHGWTELLGRALRLGARIERNLGRADEALTMIAEAELIFLSEGDDARAAGCRVLAGDIRVYQNELQAAADSFQSAIGVTGDPRDEVDAWMGLATCAQRRRDVEGATRALERARDTATRAGRRNALAGISNLQGELARQLGDPVLAERFYREATARYRALDDAGYVYSQLNVGLLMALRAAWTEAVALIEPLLERSERGGVRSVPACFARAVLLPCMAGLLEWGEFVAHCEWLEAFLTERQLFDGDLARMAALGARMAEAAGHDRLAIAAWQIALSQADGIGDPEGAAEAERRLQALGA